MAEIYKTAPSPDYPPEEGCYLRGNDFSPVAICVILKWIREETPSEIEELVRVGAESGAALSGTLQTENIGIEKMLCNITANPNIRYLIVCGPESPGHLVGDAILSLSTNGVDAHKRIIGAKAPTPYLFNIPIGSIERFRQQITVIDLINEGAPEMIREVVCACYQEKPIRFCNYLLYDPGAFPKPPLSGKITWRVKNPEKEPKNEAEKEELDRFRKISARIQRKKLENKYRIVGHSKN